MTKFTLYIFAAIAYMASSIAHAGVVVPDGLIVDEVQQPTLSKSRTTALSTPTTPTSATSGADFIFDNDRIRLELKIVEKPKRIGTSADQESMLRRAAYYVIVASTRIDGTVGTRNIDVVSTCTGTRPHLGRTQTGQGSFQIPAYAIYFGPYVTREHALEQLNMASHCVPDAYIGFGNIDRY